MPFSIVEKNRMLDTSPADFMSLHSALPDETGSNEISGGAPAYARLATAWGAAANGQKVGTNTPAFDVPAGATVKYIGFFTLVTGGIWVGYSVAGGNPFAYRVDVPNDAINADGHGLQNANLCVFFGGTPPAPLVAGTEYFVISATADTFQVSATSGGAAIVLTDDGSVETRASKIVPESFGEQGQHTVQAYTHDINF